jgi:uncharacterized protein YjbI with pentapeptide repeats
MTNTVDIMSGDPTKSSHPRGLVGAALLGLVAAAITSLLVFIVLGWTQGGDWNPWDNQTKPNLYEMARSTAAITAILGAAVGLVLALRKQQSTEQNTSIAVERHYQDQISALRDRYTTAAQQLGDLASPVRFAGVYAMSALADDWAALDKPDETQTCIDVLCAYLRTPRQPPPSDPGLSPEQLDEARAAASTADREVRRTVVRTINAHLQTSAVKPWRGRNLDFSNTDFDFDVNFSDAVFSGQSTWFDGATFSGDTRFDGATFSGGDTSFERATFQGHTSFERATFLGDTSFERATFPGTDLIFEGATFSGEARFREATFPGTDTIFERATFSGEARFDGATFCGGDTRFAEATFQGGTSFAGATFSARATSFTRATFSGRETSFLRATFSDTWFVGVTFSEGPSRFDGATFSGDTRFLRAKFQGDTSFEGALFSGRDTLFTEATFSGDTTFERATFSDTYFVRATFSGGSTSFSGILLAPGASLDFSGVERSLTPHNTMTATVTGPWNGDWPPTHWPLLQSPGAEVGPATQ